MSIRAVAVACLFAGAVVSAQTPAFEVATIKPAPPMAAMMAQIQAGTLHVGMKIDQARVDIGFMTVGDLLSTAYKVKPAQIVGPDWIRQDRYDILAKLPDGATPEQVPAMLQALLAERFMLTLHRETREQSVYALVVGKDGSRLKASVPETAPEPAGAEAQGRSIATPQGDVQIRANGNGAVVTSGEAGTTRISRTADGAMRMEMSRMSMEAFATALTQLVDRPVVNMTELEGNYEVTLELSMQDLQNAARALAPGLGGAPAPAGTGTPGALPTATDPSGGSAFRSVEQLGLKLEPRKLPVEVLVLDGGQRTPTDN
jgi:uncharacterized protein (TIGR03435 family)